MQSIQRLSVEVRQYIIITGNYWAFTLTDGALRMLVVLHFHQLGYQALDIALLFLFYEFFGVVTNLFGGWLGARWGLNKTMNIGLALQVVALCMLLVPASLLSVAWVMAAQALSGIAKDLNKMSAKSAIKTLVPKDAEGALFKWVAALTGSKNTLKGVGFFLGGVLLATLGFRGALLTMAFGLSAVWVASLVMLKQDLGKAKNKPKFKDIFSKSPAINDLSAARLFLFGARDVWFVVALPVYLSSTFGWDHWLVGSFLAIWIIMYGFVQSISPRLVGSRNQLTRGHLPDGLSAFKWALPLTAVPVLIALLLGLDLGVRSEINVALGLDQFDFAQWTLIVGLAIFGILFAINSSLHSYLIVSYAAADGVSLDVGFYYMANAMGRLIGTVLSGWVFQSWGLIACLWVSAAFVFLAAMISLRLPTHSFRK